MSRKASPPGQAGSDDRLRQLLQRAERGDPDTRPAVQLFLDAHPEVWREAGDLGVQAQRAWAALAAGPNLLVSESIRRQYEEVRAAAAGPSPPPLEGLLAERVALTWLACNYFDVVLAQHRGRGLSAAQEDHLQRLQDRAQRQHLQAVKALATVRKLVPKAFARPAADGADVDSRTLMAETGGKPERPGPVASPGKSGGSRRGRARVRCPMRNGSGRPSVGPLR